jgi:acetyl-CoA carboxylase carboxyltransferase component
MDQDRIKRLEAEKERLRRMGGPDALAKLAKTGRLNARERIGRLFDEDTFVELGLHADHAGVAPDLQDRNLPADGVITGWGKVDGRICYAIIYDFSVLAGTMGRVGEAKCAHIRELALKHKKPVLWLIDSAGARVQELGGSYFAATGYLFREQVTLSGVVPQVSVIMGPGAAGTAYIPALSDCVIMVDGRGSLALGGPPLVEAVLGEKISEQEPGRAWPICRPRVTKKRSGWPAAIWAIFPPTRRTNRRSRLPSDLVGRPTIFCHLYRTTRRPLST